MTNTADCVIELVSNGQWISPLAILVSAAIGASVALYAVLTNRDIARKRATLDMILKSESDGYFERIYTVFKSEKGRRSGLQALHNAETDGETKAKTEVDNFLNHYELIAISIQQNILDEKFYKDWMKSTYVRHYKDAREYIAVCRQKHPKAFVEFEKMALKWDEEVTVEHPPKADS